MMVPVAERSMVMAWCDAGRSPGEQIQRRNLWRTRLAPHIDPLGSVVRVGEADARKIYRTWQAVYRPSTADWSRRHTILLWRSLHPLVSDNPWVPLPHWHAHNTRITPHLSGTDRSVVLGSLPLGRDHVLGILLSVGPVWWVRGLRWGEVVRRSSGAVVLRTPDDITLYLRPPLGRELWGLNRRRRPTDYVLTTEYGDPLDRRQVGRVIKRAGRRAGIAHLTPRMLHRAQTETLPPSVPPPPVSGTEFRLTLP